VLLNINNTMIQTFIDDFTRNLNNIIPSTRAVDPRFTRVEALRVLNKYPDRIPVIVNRAANASEKTPHIDCQKFLVPDELTMGQFMYVIRKRMQLAPYEAMFLFIDGVIPPTNSLMSTVYEDMKDEDTLFLYVTYSLENTFG
jgi:GABA(A) receptor-associated protein